MSKVRSSAIAAFKWIGDKIAGKIFDTMWLSVFAVAAIAIYGWLSGKAVMLIGWLTALVLLPRWTLPAWFAGGAVAAALVALLHARRARRAFAPLAISDRKLPIHWRIKLKPADWIDDDKMASHSYQYHESILSGPFHAVPTCGAMLRSVPAGYGALENDGPLLMTHCPGCKAIAFDIQEEDAYPPIRIVRLQAIEELQRLARLGSRIRPGTLLEQPQYWAVMLPHPGASPRG